MSAAGSALLVLLIGSGAGVAATGDFGPDTCLQGYVWREAIPNDHVCVLPATRTLAATDNSLAASRRSPNGGPFGPDTCIQGFVWRQVIPSDHVCVLPATRSAAAADNAQAANRKASLNVWFTHWFPGTKCNPDGTCSTTSTDDIPRFQINGDHFNFETVTVGIYKIADNSPIWTGSVLASNHNGFVAGSFGVEADVFDCGSISKGPDTAYIRAYDPVSSRWSTPLNVKTGCAVL